MASSSETGQSSLRKLVVDANRVFSALLRDGTTRALFFERSAMFFAPETLREEIDRFVPEIARRCDQPQRDVRALARLIFRNIEWVSEESYGATLAEAKRALDAVDVKDVPYLACALAVKADAIWSHDLDFDKQTLVPRVPHPEAPIPGA